MHLTQVASQERERARAAAIAAEQVHDNHPQKHSRKGTTSARAHTTLSHANILPGSTRSPVGVIIDDFGTGVGACAVHPTSTRAGAVLAAGGGSEHEANDLHPRVILVSSAMPARALLLNAVRFDVVSVPYDASSVTLSILLRRLTRILRYVTVTCNSYMCLCLCDHHG